MDNFITTPEHFEIFKAECKRWIDFWGLHEWQIYYGWDDIQFQAQAAYRLPGMAATLTLGKKWNEEVTTAELSRSAFHEVAELLIGKLLADVENRYSTLRESDCHAHEVIRRLENKVFEGEQ